MDLHERRFPIDFIARKTSLRPGENVWQIFPRNVVATEPWIGSSTKIVKIAKYRQLRARNHPVWSARELASTTVENEARSDVLVAFPTPRPKIDMNDPINYMRHIFEKFPKFINSGPGEMITFYNSSVETPYTNPELLIEQDNAERDSSC